MIPFLLAYSQISFTGIVSPKTFEVWARAINFVLGVIDLLRLSRVIVLFSSSTYFILAFVVSATLNQGNIFDECSNSLIRISSPASMFFET